MSKYGYCEDCGTAMEAVGCPNCNEIDAIEMIEAYELMNEEQRALDE